MRYARRPEVLWRSTSRGPVVLAPGLGTPVRLEGPAAFVWEVLDVPLDLDAIQREVAALAHSAVGVDDAIAELAHRDLLVTPE